MPRGSSIALVASTPKPMLLIRLRFGLAANPRWANTAYDHCASQFSISPLLSQT